MDIRPNAYQASYWTGDAGRNWVNARAAYDAELAPFGAEVLARAAIAPGDRVLDIGCGTGAMTVDAATVAAPGEVVGIDISSTMLEAAASRAQGAGAANATFVVADAQHHSFGGAPFDVVVSRFGVMFFADPAAAFTNIAGATRRGGRLAFVCWRGAELNPWLAETSAAVEPLIGAMPAAEPGAPGPVAFADPERVRTILDASGWVDHDVADHRVALYLGGPGSVDDAVTFWSARPTIAGPVQAGPPELASQVDAALHDLFSARHDGTGVRFESAVWSVGAVRG